MSATDAFIACLFNDRAPANQIEKNAAADVWNDFSNRLVRAGYYIEKFREHSYNHALDGKFICPTCGGHANAEPMEPAALSPAPNATEAE